MRPRDSLRTTLTAAASLLALSCGSEDAASPAETDTTPILPEPAWSPCTEASMPDTECATLEVPIDHGNPGGDTIQIALSRVQAVEPDRRLGVLLLNPGGPGPGRDFATAFSKEIRDGIRAEALSRFDLVSFDPRGTGASAPVDCGDTEFLADVDWTPDDDAEWDSAEQAARDFATACGEHTGPHLGFVDAHSVAQDMDWIRSALGEEQITFWGWSYGTVMGAAYAQLFPARLRAAMLMSAIGPGIDAADWAIDRAVNFELGLDALAADCATRPECTARFGGDLRDAFDRAVELATSTPPVDAVSGKTVNESLLGIWLGVQLNLLPTTAAAVEAFIETASTGLFPEGDIAFVRQGPQGAKAGSPFFCADFGFRESAPFRSTRLAASLTPGARVAHAELPSALPCAYWPTEPRPRPTPLAGDAPPVLVVGSTGDPSTAFFWSEELAAGLENGALLVRDEVGHGGFNACINEILSQHLLDGTLPPDGTVCRD